MDIFGLNPQQRLAVTASMGPVLVLAGAGSGKTRVLTYRIAYLIEQGLVRPEAILALTFTNKAAKEMQDRVRKLLHSEFPISNPSTGSGQVFQFPNKSQNQIFQSAMPTMGTFHAFGVRVLRQFGYLLGLPARFPIFDGDDRLKVVKDIFRDEQLDEAVDPRVVSHFIHTIKNSGQAAEQVAEKYPKPVARRLVRVYELYQASLRTQGAADLDDLLLLPLRLLREFPAVKEYYQSTYSYILVDEYQDTNPIQYQFLKELSPPASLFVVGDDAQAIYGFRGSDITNILHFEKDFPNAQIITLDQNYRSTQHILEVASSVLRHSPQQIPKTLWTDNDHGPRVVVKELPTDLSEADYIVNQIVAAVSLQAIEGQDDQEVHAIADEVEQAEDRPFSVLDYLLASRRQTNMLKPRVRQLPNEHRALSDFAILYRTHAQSRALEAALMQAGVPYRIIGGLRFFERKEIKDAISYVRVLLNIKDFVALSRVVSSPPRGIGDKTLGVLRGLILGLEDSNATFDALADSMEHAPARSRAALAELCRVFQGFLAIPADFSLDAVLERVLTDSGLFAWYKQDGSEAETRQENLRELISVARRFSLEPWKDALPKFLEEVVLMNDVDSVSDDTDALTLMTLHAAKGLEFDTVYLAGLEEGLLPHSRSVLDPAQLAEEVRLLYVGVTRARKALTITFVRQRGMFGDARMAVPSRFLRELPEGAVDWQGGRQTYIVPPAEQDGGLAYEPFEE